MKTNDIYMGDPFIYTHNGIYYLIGTTSETEGFKGYKSTDLENWEEIGWLLNKKDTGFGQTSFWAPEMFYHEGKFYMTYSAYYEKTGKLTMAIAVSDSPTGPFKNLYAPWFTAPDKTKGTIDGHIFRDDDGKLYLYFSMNWFDAKKNINTGENYGARIRDDFTVDEESIVFISRAEMPWETPIPTNRCNEGPTVIKKDGTYFMTYSANDTFSKEYGMGYLISKKPLEGWEKISKEPWYTSSESLFSPGHNSIFTDLDGNLKIVFHALKVKGVYDRSVNIKNLFISNDRLYIED